MDSATKLRWSILALMMSATVTAIFYPVDQDSADLGTPAKTVAADGKPAAVSSAPLGHDSVWEPLLSDPFAQRQWEAPAAAPAPVVAAVATAPAPPPAPVVAPPLPFQFVGQMSDSNEKVVYLARGDVAVLAHNGEVLDGTYKVLAVSDSQIEFEHIPTSQRQVLVFPIRNN